MTVEIDGANNIVKTNTISEVTSANGVTVDGLNIKDSKLVTANSVITANITDANVTTAKITDANVTQGKIADQAINEAKMQISNAPVNGYMLTAQSGNTGGLTWASAPSGGLVHMATTEITSNTASVTFISGTGGVDFNSGAYENFLIIANGVTLTNDDDSFRISVSIDAGSNYNSQLYMAQDTVEMTQSGSSASAGQVGQSSSGAIAMLDSVGNNLGNASAFHIWCYDFNSQTQKKYMQVEALMEQHNLIYKKRSSLINIAERTVAVDGIRFNCNAGSIAKGKFRVYGITKG